ncbi:hypothetical protein ATK74_2762 [Propionicimonas paludicola]|uniref:Uncharacterized protein n=1 Tax=Propionicimonas paludicola TaxID=185243 RepID=A0A2A9CX20_9ACTN|nr:hypothetical protein ATK74_2762 [Propionicimonas paludicola]
MFVATKEFNELVVTLEPLGADGADHAVEVNSRFLGDGWWQAAQPRVPAGTYLVSLFAADTTSSGGSGDMVADLMWTIDTDR